MKANEITLEFVNSNFYECDGKVCRKDGRKCKNRTNSLGYCIIGFKYNEYNGHRILWMLYNQKEIPEGYVIDHIDGNPGNNRKENLRLATISQNRFNSKMHSRNTSGIKGISVYKNNGIFYYFCEITTKYKRKRISFPYTPEGLEQAKLWLEEKRKELHGEFARSC